MTAKKTNLRLAAVQDLVEQYRQASAAHGRELESGNHRRANKAAVLGIEIDEELTALGERRALLGLVNDADVAVQLWAATVALELEPVLGETKLNTLAEGRHGFVSTTAFLGLKEWRKRQDESKPEE